MLRNAPISVNSVAGVEKGMVLMLEYQCGGLGHIPFGWR